MPSPGHSLPDSETSSAIGTTTRKDNHRYLNMLKKEIERLVATPETTDSNTINIEDSHQKKFYNRYYDKEE